MEIGTQVQSINEIDVIVKKKVKGKIYKIETECGIKYAYFQTEEGDLKRFELDKIEEYKGE